MTCDTCEYWTRYDIGKCSQKVKTTDNKFVNLQTLGNQFCETFNKKQIKEPVPDIIKISSPDGTINYQFTNLKRNAKYKIYIEKIEC